MRREGMQYRKIGFGWEPNTRVNWKIHFDDCFEFCSHPNFIQLLIYGCRPFVLWIMWCQQHSHIQEAVQSYPWLPSQITADILKATHSIPLFVKDGSTFLTVITNTWFYTAFKFGDFAKSWCHHQTWVLTEGWCDLFRFTEDWVLSKPAILPFLLSLNTFNVLPCRSDSCSICLLPLRSKILVTMRWALNIFCGRRTPYNNGRGSSVDVRYSTSHYYPTYVSC